MTKYTKVEAFERAVGKVMKPTDDEWEEIDDEYVRLLSMTND